MALLRRIAPRPVGQNACEPGVLVESHVPRQEPPVHAGGSNAEEDLKTQSCYEWVSNAMPKIKVIKERAERTD